MRDINAIIVDVAHRTQEGNLVEKLHAALPNSAQLNDAHPSPGNR